MGGKTNMTTSSNDYAEFVKDRLASLRDIESGRFFGGIGLSSAGTQFAMVMGSSLYFVVDDTTRPRYEKMGSSCFSYNTSKKRVAVRKYYAVPTELIEDQDQLVSLAQESIRVATSAKQGPTKRSNTTRRKRRAV
jgi:DNA transformation protein